MMRILLLSTWFPYPPDHGAKSRAHHLVQALADVHQVMLVAPGDVVQLGQRLRQLLETPVLCRQMGEQARRAALSQWTAERHITQLVRVFETASTHRD